LSQTNPGHSTQSYLICSLISLLKSGAPVLEVLNTDYFNRRLRDWHRSY
jgi:hypothetical protein